MALGLDIAALQSLLPTGIAGVEDVVHAVAGEDWPDDPTNIIFPRVERDATGTLIESSPRVVYGGPPVFVAGTTAGSGAGATVTTSAIDTTGASGIFLVASWDPTTTASVTVSDSKGNTWTGLTARTIGVVKVQIYYTVPTSVGTGHTFTVAGAASLPTVSVAAFSGINPTPFDVENGATVASDIELPTGTATPTVSYSVAIIGASIDDTSGNPPRQDDDYTVLSTGQTANHRSGGLGYFVQLSADATNPTWKWSNAGPGAAAVAVFKGNDKVYEHADLPFRCVDPDDGTVSHEIPLFRDVAGGLFVEWDEWYSINTVEEMTNVVISQNPTTCAYTTTLTFTSYDHIQSYFNTPKLIETITVTPP